MPRLKLAVLAFGAQPDEASFLSLVSGQGRGVADLFVETVLLRQSRGMKEFLLATSILDRLRSFANAVTGQSDARAMIDQIAEMGLFLFSLDQERQWYRYHNLFSDFLRRRLAEEHPGLELNSTGAGKATGLRIVALTPRHLITLLSEVICTGRQIY